MSIRLPSICCIAFGGILGALFGPWIAVDALWRVQNDRKVTTVAEIVATRERPSSALLVSAE